MTLRTKTLSAVSALLVGTAGLAFAQDTQTEQQVLTAPADTATESEATAEPAAEAPAGTEEAAQEPAAAEAPAEEAVAEPAAEPAAEAAVTEEPAADETAAEEAPADEPAATEPAAEQAVTEETPAEEPAAEEPAAEEPAEAEAEAPAEEPAEAEAPAAVETEAEAEEGAAEAEAAVETEETQAEAEGEGEGGGHIEDIAFSFEGPFGKYDQFQLQRGLQVYTEVCAACHGMKQVAIRTLHDEGGPGLPEDQVRAYAANLTGIIDEETGEERPRVPTDHFPTVSGDGMGPDLSLMAKARAGFHGPYGTGISQLINGIGGPEYIHAILTSYTGEDIEQAGTVLYENGAFAGGYIGMPAPLSDELVTYEDGTPATVDQMARDVSAFLMWTAEPKMSARKQVGLVSVLFLIVLSGLLYYTNKRLWAPHKGKH
ncbi:cytochrome c1 [Paracoccus sp. M683]|nr:cytochrome c1 [Paracoccus sp. M683]